MSIRSDNADTRLTAKGREAGVVSDERWERFERTKDGVRCAIELLKSYSLTPHVCLSPYCLMYASHSHAELEERWFRCTRRRCPAEVCATFAKAGVVSYLCAARTRCSITRT